MNATQTLVLLKPEDIQLRVNTSNSFSKAEMLAHRSQIRDMRAAKRTRLAKMDGAQLGLFASEAMKAGAVVQDIKTRSSATQQTWTIKMVAKVHKSEADALKDQIKRAAKKLNELEEKYTEATAKTV